MTVTERVESVASEKRRRRPKGDVRRLLLGQSLVLILLILIVYFSFASPFFLQVDNLLNILASAAALGVMAATQTYLVIARGFDVSVGSVVAMTGVIIGLTVRAGSSVWLGVLLALVVAVAIGALNGFISIRLGVNPLITTLGTLSIFSGLAYIISGGQTLLVGDEAFAVIGSGYVGRVPATVFVLLLVFAVAFFVERYTRVGRNFYAIGSNPEAARLSGIAVDRLSFTLYVVSGLSAGVAGVIVTSQLAAGSPQVGASYLLSVVTAVVLGGTSLAGGRGSTLGTLLAVIILGVLQNGFALMQLSAYVQTTALGVALILAVLLDQTIRALEDK
jgi:ribose transport system permease protein